MKTYKIPEAAIKEFGDHPEMIARFQKNIDGFYNAVDPVLQVIKVLPKDEQVFAIYQIFSTAPSESEKRMAVLVIGQEIGDEVTQEALLMERLSKIFGM